MLTPSKEQLNILSKINKHNIIVDCVSGSGKTTTSLHIAKTFTSLKILLITYNAKLKLETRTKVNTFNLNNIEVHSYHSFCVKYYDHKCYTDRNIIKIVDQNTNKLRNFSYDLIILDEAQDVTSLYYSLVCKIYNDNNINNVNNKCKICILGDQYQSIYGFNGADPRFIKFGDQLFDFNDIAFDRCNLSMSFRITNEMANFVNHCLLNSNRIKAQKRGSRVRYILGDVFSDRAYQEISYYLRLGYKYQDIFVLAPSVRAEMSPVRQLANKLSENSIPIYVPNSDEEKIDEEVLINKIVFSTYHQVKGLERKVILVFGFDSSYFEFYKKNVNKYICPNEIYVATTRGLEQLTVFHHHNYNYLDFINVRNIRKYCHFIEQKRLKIKRFKNINFNQKTCVTDLCRHLPINVIDEALQYVDITKIKEPKDIIDIPIKTQQQELYENVADITGTAIPAYFELQKTNKMSIFQNINNNQENQNNRICMFNDEEDEDNNEDNNNLDITKINIKNLSPQQLLFIANKWISTKSDYVYKLYQIQDYNWLSQDNLNKCITRLNKYITNKSMFEIQININGKAEMRDRELIGYIDCIDRNNVWELKCVGSLSQEHLLQTAIYMYMHKQKLQEFQIVDINNFKYNYLLFNIIDEEMYLLDSDLDRLTIMLDLLIYHKYYNNNTIPDNIFIKNILDIKDTYILNNNNYDKITQENEDFIKYCTNYLEQSKLNNKKLEQDFKKIICDFKNKNIKQNKIFDIKCRGDNDNIDIYDNINKIFVDVLNIKKNNYKQNILDLNIDDGNNKLKNILCYKCKNYGHYAKDCYN